MLTASCVAVDWGTSSFRLWVIEENGNILDTITGPYGMSLLKSFEYENVLEEALQNVGITSSLPVIISGMAGSAQGWCEALYLSTPMQLDWLNVKATREKSVSPGAHSAWLSRRNLLMSCAAKKPKLQDF